MILGVVAVCHCAGCSDADYTSPARARKEGWTTVRLQNTSRAEAMAACEYAVKQWFRVEEVSQPNGQIKSVMMEYNQRGGTERIRDVVKFPNRMRHQARVVVLEQGPDTLVRCAVMVQRLDTADRRVFRDQDRFTDYPNDTPIDRDAGVTANQSEVWTDLPRDRQLESDILGVVKNRVAKSPTTATAS